MKWIIVGIAALLTACGEPVQGAPEGGDTIQLPPIEWRVRDRVALEQAYRESGMDIGSVRRGQHTVRDRLHGFTGHTATGERVIYTLPPQRVDDAVACTIGHEIMHVALGDYHK